MSAEDNGTETREQERARIWREGWKHYQEYFSPNFPEFGVNPYDLEARK